MPVNRDRVLNDDDIEPGGENFSFFLTETEVHRGVALARFGAFEFDRGKALLRVFRLICSTGDVKNERSEHTGIAGHVKTEEKKISRLSIDGQWGFL